jgi:hypothetical protein
MANSRSIRALCTLLLMAAGCYSDRNVGVSSGNKPDDPAPAEPVRLKFPSVIVGQAGESLFVSRPTVGDMDGDGFDDFVLTALKSSPNEDIASNHQSLYLFYGRPEFPPQLSTADADAVFDTEGDVSGPVGDVNGDGLGDLQLTRMNSVEFVFGRKQRYNGVIAPETAGGAVWRAGELPPPFAPGFATQFYVMPAGDLDGDKCADLIVSATVLLAPNDDGFGGGIAMRSFLVRGHRGEWESASWDPNWASTGFGFDAKTIATGTEQSLLYPQGIGDLDGDGLSDLLASGGQGSWLFYGKPDYPRELTSSDADARLTPPGDSVDAPLDSQVSFYQVELSDLDGDGMSDLPMLDPNTNRFHLVYGERWSGDKALDPDLTLLLEDQNLQQVQDFAIGDIDGDTFPELMLSVASIGGWPGQTAPDISARPGIYLIRGTGERLTGTRQLTSDYRWTPPTETAAGSKVDAGAMFFLKLAGDIDGDGSQDILTMLMDPSKGEQQASIYLVPSTPKAPD